MHKIASIKMPLKFNPDWSGLILLDPLNIELANCKIIYYAPDKNRYHVERKASAEFQRDLAQDYLKRKEFQWAYQHYVYAVNLFPVDIETWIVLQNFYHQLNMTTHVNHCSKQIEFLKNRPH